MRHALPELYARLGEAGLRDDLGFPARAVMAAIAVAEGADPDAWVEHDPPTNPRAAPSTGLYQIHRAAWPAIYAATERVRLSGLPDAQKIVLMTELAKPILLDALEAADATARTLKARGVYVDPLNTALFVDRAWQTGADNLARWARVTRTGDPRELGNPTRVTHVEVALRHLAGGALEAVDGLGFALGLAVVGGFCAWALSQWKT